jgi:FtsH-binding integral membrane protein
VNYILLFFAQLGLIFIKAFQQKNVTGNHLMAAVLTTWVFAAIELAYVGSIIHAILEDGKWSLLYLSMALGASGGVYLAINLHQRVMK